MNDDAIRREPLKKVLEDYRHTREYLSDEEEAQNTLLDWILEDINTAHPVQMWTPCSEKQPESDGVYYVTVIFNGKSVTRDQVFHEGRWLPLGKLMVNGVSGEPEVIAWMEKPAPYQAPVLDLQQSGLGRA